MAPMPKGKGFPAMNMGMGGMGGMSGMGGMGGFDGPAAPPPMSSTDPYLDRQLRSDDLETFSGAALLPYRKVADGLEVLLITEKPWNSFTSTYDAEALNVLGGKRIFRSEYGPVSTAMRIFYEVMPEDMVVPTSDELKSLVAKSFSMWFPTGKYALLMFEVKEDTFKDIPEKFAEARKAMGPREEFTITKDGVKKWTKQIESFVWVPASELVPDCKRECTNLLQNVLKISGFVDFLTGKLNPDAAFPGMADEEPTGPSKGGKAKGKDKGKGGKDKGGKDKGGKDKGSKGGKSAKSYGGGKCGGCGGMMPFGDGKGWQGNGKGWQGEQQMMDKYNEVQLQMYGEQLFILVKPLVSNQVVAQKITGMLLELPMNELMLNLTNPEELHRRVTEATALLKSDGIV